MGVVNGSKSKIHKDQLFMLIVHVNCLLLTEKYN